MNNVQVADIFDEIADLLEFQGANPFRVRAYRGGARAIRDLSEPIAAIAADQERALTEIPGIGEDLAGKCRQLLEHGTLPLLEELHAQVPASVLTLMRIPGLGPKKAAVLYRELHVQTLAQLESACRTEKVRALKGFGAKTEQIILQGLHIAAAADQRTLWADADRLAQELLAFLRECPAIAQMEMAGSYRRGKETVGDLDILVVSAQPGLVMDRLAEYPDREVTIGRGDTKMSVRMRGGMQVDLRVVPADSFGAALQYFTGSKDHNVVLRGIARQQGLKINEYGVFRTEGAKDGYVAGRTEEEVYAAVGLPWFPPELREARQEFEWAERDQLPQLLQLSDIRGDLHSHTDATDGKAPLDDMIAAAQQRGLKYMAVTDHSQRVSMANGLNAKRLLEQWKNIDRVNQQAGSRFTVLKGIECDILEQGGMDLPNRVLAQGDWVVASIHYGQKQSRQQITDRIIGALKNPHVSVIAHPTGRLINRREPYDLDMEAVFQAAREYGKFLELNANPQRLDLNDVHCAAAKRCGVKIVISTDAHSPHGYDDLKYGVLQARRGGLTADDVVNTRTWRQIQKMLAK